MSLVLQSSGGGLITIQEPATASNFTQTLPAGTGTIIVGGTNSAIVNGTAVTASGTSIDFTGIPSWVKRITVMFNGVSTNGSSNYLVQIGSGSFTTTGYVSSASITDSGTAVSSYTAGFGIRSAVSSNICSGILVLALFNSNTWVSNHTIGTTGSNSNLFGGGASPALSGALDRVRITTVNGTDAFDAGSINILYE